MGYIFEPQILLQVAQTALAKEQAIENIVPIMTKDLSLRYPGHIDPSPQWIFNNAGGAMGAMCMLHVSLTEYVIIFGTPIGTEGHTGRFFTDDYFIILSGEQWAFRAGQFSREVYRPGDLHHLKRRQAKQYRIPESCWALEYARGPIPTMLPFGIADTFTSTLDFTGLAQMLWIYAKGAVRELLQGKI